MVYTGLLFVCGLGSGGLGAMLGLGGGVFLVPMLVLAFGLPMHTAIAASIVAVIATSCVSASSCLDAGLTNLRLSVVLLVTTCAGAVAGGLMATLVGDALLALLFSLVMLYAACSLYRSTQSQYLQKALALPEVDERSIGQPGSSAEHRWDRLASTYQDLSQRCQVRYQPRRLPLGLGLSMLAGIVSGLLGIGGGVVQVPVMHLAMGVPVRAAAGTSNYMVGVAAAASAFVYYGHGYVDPSVAIPIVLGVFFGARLGARLAQTLRASVLSRVLAIVLLFVTAQMFLRAVGISLM